MPLLSPVKASAGSALGPPHDSEPVWFATPSLHDALLCRFPGAFALFPVPAHRTRHWQISRVRLSEKTHTESN